MADLYSVGGNGTLSVEIENVSIGNLRAMPQFNINNQFRNKIFLYGSQYLEYCEANIHNNR